MARQLKEQASSSETQSEQLYRILLADDDPMVREMLTTRLERMGYQVTAAADGAEAIGIFRDGGIDLVLTDLMMPKLNGLDLLLAVKDTNPRIPVIMISGFGDMDSVLFALNHGAQNFLTKPVMAEELERVLERLKTMELIGGPVTKVPFCLSQELTFEVPSREEYVKEVLSQLSRSAVAVGFCEDSLSQSLGMAIGEGIINAMEHAHRWDESQLVRVRSRFTSHEMEVEITDRGPGFDYEDLPDPLLETNLYNERGRGVFLMRAILDQVIFNPTGNTVTLKKAREPEEDSETPA